MRLSRAAAAHNDRGVELLDSAHVDEAIAAFRAALTIDATFASAAYNLGKALLETGDLNEAHTWLERAIEIEPGNASFYLPLIHGGFAQVKPGHVAAVVKLSAQLDSLPHAQRVDLHFARLSLRTARAHR
jgi:tetratricopeptide (TPR) repeat protein